MGRGQTPLNKESGFDVQYGVILSSRSYKRTKTRGNVNHRECKSRSLL